MPLARPTINDETNWDDSARLVLIIARQEAEEMGAEYVGTEHLLLALVSETPPGHHRIAKLTHGSVKKLSWSLTCPKAL